MSYCVMCVADMLMIVIYLRRGGKMTPPLPCVGLIRAAVWRSVYNSDSLTLSAHKKSISKVFVNLERKCHTCQYVSLVINNLGDNTHFAVACPSRILETNISEIAFQRRAKYVCQHLRCATFERHLW